MDEQELTAEHTERQRRYIAEALEELPPDVIGVIFRIVLGCESGLE